MSQERYDLAMRAINYEIGLGETNVAAADLSFLYALRVVLDIHKPIPHSWREGKIICQHCAGLCHSYSELACEGEGDGAYPCYTAEIIIEGILR